MIMFSAIKIHNRYCYSLFTAHSVQLRHDPFISVVIGNGGEYLVY